MKDSRHAILQSVRRSLAGQRLPAPPAAELAPAVYDADRNELLERFKRELAAVGGVFVGVPAAQAAARVAELASQCGAGQALAWAEAALPVHGVYEALRRRDIAVFNVDLPTVEPARGRALAQAAELAVGITGADAALADTGTLALITGPGRPRLASLSVRVHIALFRLDQLWPSLAAWWASQPAGAAGASNLTLITGPSRTADIEMTLTVGVHGPAELIAVGVV
jgi:L-lactate dehydrogenase complex protein LldG